MRTKLNVYSDGGARGNPGPAAAAFTILSEDEKVLKSESRFLGKRTNNQAEYEALILALQASSTLDAEEAIFHLDSELVCKQQTGQYRVRNPELLKLWLRTQQLKRAFKHIRFVNVPRENKFISEVDRLVNLELDRSGQK